MQCRLTEHIVKLTQELQQVFLLKFHLVDLRGCLASHPLSFLQLNAQLSILYLQLLELVFFLLELHEGLSVLLVVGPDAFHFLEQILLKPQILLLTRPHGLHLGLDVAELLMVQHCLRGGICFFGHRRAAASLRPHRVHCCVGLGMCSHARHVAQAALFNGRLLALHALLVRLLSVQR